MFDQNRYCHIIHVFKNQWNGLWLYYFTTMRHLSTCILYLRQHLAKHRYLRLPLTEIARSKLQDPSYSLLPGWDSDSQQLVHAIAKRLQLRPASHSPNSLDLTSVKRARGINSGP
jgi:hypothetical protein